MTRPEIKIEVQRPVLLTLALVFCAIAVLSSDYYRGYCVPLSNRDLDMVRYYAVTRFGAAPANVKVSEEGILPESCVHRIKLAGASSIPPYWYVSGDRKYIFQGAGLIARPQPKAQPLAPVDREVLESGSAPVLGPRNSPNSIVVFSDFQCPYCATLSKSLGEMNISSGAHGMHLVFRHYPLPFHTQARPAAEAAACLAVQDESFFWEFNDYVFSNQSRLGETTFVNAATRTIGSKKKVIDRTRLRDCIDRHASAAIVDADVHLAEKLGVEGTPTVFVNGVRLSGAPNQASLLSAISTPRRGAVR